MNKKMKYFLFGVGAVAVTGAAAYILLKSSDNRMFDVSENDVTNIPKKQSNTAGFTAEDIERRKQHMQEKLSKNYTHGEIKKNNILTESDTSTADVKKDTKVAVTNEQQAEYVKSSDDLSKNNDIKE